MKTHLTDSDILDMAFEKLDVANPNVNKVMEIAELMGLEYDEEKAAYYNPDCYSCGKVLGSLDVKMGRCKKAPYLCVSCYTSNA